MIMKYKKILFVIALSAGLTSGAFASGIPTVDAAAIAQMVQQLTQLQQMYSQLQAQYNTAVSQLNAITGNRGLGMIHYDSKLRNLIPLDAQLRLNAIVRGTGSLSSLGKEVFDRLNLGQACENYTGEVKENCLKSQSFVAEQQAILEETQKTVTQRLEKVELLMQQINSATDAKAIADLSARIQAEQVALSSSKDAAEFQNQQAEIVKEQARQEAMKQIFPELTQEDVKNALKPIKVR